MTRWELSRLSERIEDVSAGSGAGGLGPATRAHLEESRARIERALEASLTLPTGS